MTSAIARGPAESAVRIERRPFALVFAEYFPPYMGSDRRIFDIIRHVRGWALEFAVTPPLRILGGRHEAALAEYFQRHFLDGIVEDESGGIHGHYFLLPRMLMGAWRHLPMPIAYGLTLPYLIVRATAYIRRKRPDLVVVAHPSYLCGLVALAAAKLCGVPTLLDYPDAWTPLAVETSGIDERSLTARVLDKLERVAARGADRVVSITHGLTNHIRRMGAKQTIDIVSNGADHKRFDPATATCARERLSLPKDQTIILYSGRLEAWSGVSELVETISRVRAICPDVLFLFVGDGSSAGEFRDAVREHQLEDAVRFVGVQPFAWMPGLVKAVDITIVPFPHTPTTEYCAPVKLYEYMLMEKPIVTTDLPGIRESVSEEHVSFISQLNAEELSSAIASLLRDPEKARAMAERSAIHCREQFTYEALAAAFERSMSETAKVAHTS